jgi:hypothetical protein
MIGPSVNRPSASVVIKVVPPPGLLSIQSISPFSLACVYVTRASDNGAPLNITVPVRNEQPRSPDMRVGVIVAVGVRVAVRVLVLASAVWVAAALAVAVIEQELIQDGVLVRVLVGVLVRVGIWLGVLVITGMVGVTVIGRTVGLGPT